MKKHADELTATPISPDKDPETSVVVQVPVAADNTADMEFSKEDDAAENREEISSPQDVNHQPASANSLNSMDDDDMSMGDDMMDDSNDGVGLDMDKFGDQQLVSARPQAHQ